MVLLTFDNNEVGFESSTKSSPIDYLMISVVLCIGSEIKEMNDELRRENPFKVIVFFSEHKVKIRCKTTKSLHEEFRSLVQKCYILKNLKFENEIIFV